ncbi:glycogen synthase [Parahaliea maris]|uniref:starch synthase n=1 Tax=Parahaliea maris TaxID=2716870 RepID=A0A5C9A760_9GAMM|nr:glycogen/starch synthase [Parahaliea maris]TXS96578.1 glycogen synthase [Parahaliea maris]
MHVLMVAAENGALPGGKVGGMGDVLRDVPEALAQLGHEVSVLTPGYQSFSRLPGAQRRAVVNLTFGDRLEQVELFRLPQRPGAPGVADWALEHPLFAAAGAGRIYSDDPPDRPFATDATRFALFCAAVVQVLAGQRLSRPDVVHLHDWHTALVGLLIASAPSAKALAGTRLVYTIHNLALQGIRPFAGDDSSLEAWFPGLTPDREAICDPRYPDCLNLMRAGINLCHKVHTVSPTYAREIQQPAAGDSGGAGLEQDLQRAAQEGRLEGIINGCTYPDAGGEAVPFADWPARIRPEVLRWMGASATVSTADFLALHRLDGWEAAPPPPPALMATSVGRLTTQKVSLLLQAQQDGRTALAHVLDRLGDDGLLVVLGSGDPALEQAFTQQAATSERLLFLRGYSEALSNLLYASGDLFLMPSSFEPCGISQMLAMRAGQPCLVHAVGGLADTVEDGRTGFSFAGEDPQAQSQAMLQCLDEALALHRKPRSWRALCKRAAAVRFPWDEVARAYEAQLYR